MPSSYKRAPSCSKCRKLTSYMYQLAFNAYRIMTRGCSYETFYCTHLAIDWCLIMVLMGGRWLIRGSNRECAGFLDAVVLGIFFFSPFRNSLHCNTRDCLESCASQKLTLNLCIKLTVKEVVCVFLPNVTVKLLFGREFRINERTWLCMQYYTVLRD